MVSKLSNIVKADNTVNALTVVEDGTFYLFISQK